MKGSQIAYAYQAACAGVLGATVDLIALDGCGDENAIHAARVNLDKKVDDAELLFSALLDLVGDVEFVVKER